MSFQSGSRTTDWLRASLLAFLALMVVLAILTLARGLPVHAFLNATSQWLHGPDVSLNGQPDLARTGLGAVTNFAACLFWGLIATALHRALPLPHGVAAWVAGIGTAVAAITLDYGILPRAFSPGWHLALPPASVAAGFAAMGAGFSLALRASRPHPFDRKPMP